VTGRTTKDLAAAGLSVRLFLNDVTVNGFGVNCRRFRGGDGLIAFYKREVFAAGPARFLVVAKRVSRIFERRHGRIKLERGAEPPCDRGLPCGRGRGMIRAGVCCCRQALGVGGFGDLWQGFWALGLDVVGVR